MRLRRGILCIPVMGALLAAAPEALAQTSSRAQIEHDLSGFESAPTAATVRGWGPGAAQTLMELGADGSALLHTRLRAVHALGTFAAQPGVRAYLEAMARRDGQGVPMLRAALDALVDGGDYATANGFLADARSDVRDAASWALLRSSAPAARALLADRLRVETDPTVRRTLADGLRPAQPGVTGVAVPARVTR